VDIGGAEELARTPLKSCIVRTIAIAISFKDEQFGAVSNVCNHVGGPLSDGRLVICPWHRWKLAYVYAISGRTHHRIRLRRARNPRRLQLKSRIA